MEVIRLGTGLSIRYQGREVLFIKEEDAVNSLEDTVSRIIRHLSYQRGFEDGKAFKNR